MAQAYCNNCKEIMPLRTHIKKAVCKCGSKDLITVTGEWNDKCGFDYFDRSGKFLKFVPHIPYGEPEQPQEIKHHLPTVKQLTLQL